MLDDKERKKIKDLIKQGKSNYRIGKERKHSPNTINNIRESMGKTRQEHTQGEDVTVDNSIHSVHQIINEIDALIQAKQLGDKERREWEKRGEQLREMIKDEVDFRISLERLDAEKKRDEYWEKYIQQNYVKKEKMTALESINKEKEMTIVDFERRNKEQNEKSMKNQFFLSNLIDLIQEQGKRIRDLEKEKNAYLYQNINLHQYIANRFDDDVRQGMEQLKHERNVFTKEKKDFTTTSEKQISTLEELFFEVEYKRKNIEIREKKLDEQEEKIKKREAEFDTYKNSINNNIHKIIIGLKNRMENVDMIEKTLKKLFDKQNEEITQEKKKIKEEQEQITK
ncbi:hypothetical protein AYK25_05435 [Thermoplasmatales archaeon SM1-50]|nr:MAG: hypothetical protein AYK25_05435 [Thermoplasmatales archaeon SM1-50]